MCNDRPRTLRHRTTFDLAFAGFAKLRGLQIIKAQEWRTDSTGNKYEFTFADPDNIWEQLHVDFANSEVAQYDSSIRTLKKMCKVQHAHRR